MGKLRRTGNNKKVRTAIEPSNIVRSFLIRTESKNELQKSKNYVYEVPCEHGRNRRR